MVIMFSQSNYFVDFRGFFFSLFFFGKISWKAFDYPWCITRVSVSDLCLKKNICNNFQKKNIKQSYLYQSIFMLYLISYHKIELFRKKRKKEKKNKKTFKIFPFLYDSIFYTESDSKTIYNLTLKIRFSKNINIKKNKNNLTAFLKGKIHYFEKWLFSLVINHKSAYMCF